MASFDGDGVFYTRMGRMTMGTPPKRRRRWMAQVVSLLAGLLPANRAANVDPVKALKRE